MHVMTFGIFFLDFWSMVDVFAARQEDVNFAQCEDWLVAQQPEQAAESAAVLGQAAQLAVERFAEEVQLAGFTTNCRLLG